MSGEVIGYMCMVDFEDELGYVSDGNHVYPSLDALKKYHPTWDECGVVKVKVSFVETVIPRDFNWKDDEDD